MLACLLVLATTGCGSGTVDGLVGRWEGRPDSAVAFQARQAALPAAAAPGEKTEAPSAETPPIPSSPPFPDVTELEQYNVRVVLDFVRGGSMTMWLDDGRDRLAGRWKLSDVDGRQAILHIVARPDDNRQPAQRRRFELQWDQDGTGFTLREEGADPQLGWLYFRRVES